MCSESWIYMLQTMIYSGGSQQCYNTDYMLHPHSMVIDLQYCTLPLEFSNDCFHADHNLDLYIV